MKFTITVRNSGGGGAWTENYNEDSVTNQEQAEHWADETLAFFNRTCEQGEPTRRLVSVNFREGNSPGKHWWVKQNIITLQDHRGMFDEVKCKKCGITARRYGLTAIKRSAKFRSGKWANCQGSGTCA